MPNRWHYVIDNEEKSINYDQRRIFLFQIHMWKDFSSNLMFDKVKFSTLKCIYLYYYLKLNAWIKHCSWSEMNSLRCKSLNIIIEILVSSVNRPPPQSSIDIQRKTKRYVSHYFGCKWCREKGRYQIAPRKLAI